LKKTYFLSFGVLYVLKEELGSILGNQKGLRGDPSRYF